MHTRHARHTITRNGYLYINRRVPASAREGWGAFVRLKVPDAETANRINERLTALWEASPNQPVALSQLLEAAKPIDRRLSAVLADYLSIRSIVAENKVAAVIGDLTALSGDIDIENYTRADARSLLASYVAKGNKTSSIRRKLNAINAVFNYAYAEHGIEKRNPFSRLQIKGEGADVQTRGVFTANQLWAGYTEALGTSDPAGLLMPVLGETGCRVAEIIGLRLEDVDLPNRLIHIRPHASRRLKTRGSERTLPLVGAGEQAMAKLLTHREGKDGDRYLFPRFTNDRVCRADIASNVINRWIKPRFDGLTAHSLRHAFRDRLREAECPLEMIDQMGGWSSVGGVGTRYGTGYKLEHVRQWLERIQV